MSRIAALFLLLATPAVAQAPPPTGDIPAEFKAPEVPREFEARTLMIPMRDGVKLNTILIIPSGVKKAPIIFDRTPYSAARYTGLGGGSGQIAANLLPVHAELAAAGYIVALQDVRGKHGSEGVYAITRPLKGPLNADSFDNSTDSYDSIDWMVKNLPEANGRVGLFGISYDGFTTLMGLVNPHPAMKAAVPVDPMVDGWIGDDWFHNGAYRQQIMDWIYTQSTSKDSKLKWPEPRYDAYESWMEAGSAGEMARRRGVDKLPFWQRVAANPAYTPFWQQQAMDRILGSKPLPVPTLLVHGQWDQEDIYGNPKLHETFAADPRNKGRLFYVNGPWSHGGGVLTDGASLGALKFRADTGHQFRQMVLIPFYDQHLKPGAPRADIAPVTSFTTGINKWQRLDRWPLSCAKGCPSPSKPLYLAPGGKLSFTPAAGGADFSEYVSDPAKPVTYRPRPIRPTAAEGSSWNRWLVDDQRFAADRPDVLVFVSEPLTQPVRIAGQPIARLFASTSGTDSDWVVKLIDVYPDAVPADPAMGGYQLGVSMDILRARYRDDPANPSPVPANQVLGYTLKLPHADHVFLPGHRIMVQVQSSWFPLYDRNPQTYVENIFFAKPADYKPATQRLFHRPGAETHIELPVAPL